MEVKNVYESNERRTYSRFIKNFRKHGSVARNEYTDESDIDIAIILKNEIDNKTKEQFINWSADMDIRYDRVFSIIDIKESNIQKWGDSLPFYRNVKKEGIVLWKAA